MGIQPVPTAMATIHILIATILTRLAAVSKLMADQATDRSMPPRLDESEPQCATRVELNEPVAMNSVSQSQ